MKCIYCNAEDELTSSDIITYAITGMLLLRYILTKINMMHRKHSITIYR